METEIIEETVSGEITDNSSNGELSPGLKFINALLTRVDGVIDKMGVWFRIVFIYLWPIAAMYYPVRFIIVGSMRKYFENFSSSAQSAIVICSLGVFLIIIFFMPKVATFFELIFCSFYILLKVFGISDFIFYQFNAYSGKATSPYIIFGVILCILLLFGKLMFFIYKILKCYRRKHMKKRTTDDEYYDFKFYDDQIAFANEPKKTREDTRNNRECPVDQEGFIVDKNKDQRIKGSNLPDMTGFIVSSDEQK